MPVLCPGRYERCRTIGGREVLKVLKVFVNFHSSRDLPVSDAVGASGSLRGSLGFGGTNANQRRDHEKVYLWDLS